MHALSSGFETRESPGVNDVHVPHSSNTIEHASQTELLEELEAGASEAR
jgi:hypothetical protein